jgi:hypothetical protein
MRKRQRRKRQAIKQARTPRSAEFKLLIFGQRIIMSVVVAELAVLRGKQLLNNYNEGNLCAPRLWQPNRSTKS